MKLKLFVAITFLLHKYVVCQSKPNVLFIVSDDLRPFLASYDDPIAITPNIDRLASNGFVFRNAYSQQALCGPSRTSFLTSRRPDSLHLYDVHSYWRQSVGNFTTIPQHFKESGYYTVSVGKVFHKGIVSGHTDDYPFSWSQVPYHGSTEKYKMSKVCLPTFKQKLELQMNIVCPVDVRTQPEGTLPDIQATEFAVNFIQNYDKKQPLFMGLGFHKPHIPLKYPREFLEYYPLSVIKLAEHRKYPSKSPIVAWNPFDDMRARDDIMSLNLTYPFGLIPDYYQLLIKQSYYAAITYADKLIGDVIEALEKKSMLNNTIIVLIGDHGWSLGEHGEWSKYSNFDVATRVPLIVSFLNGKMKQIDVHEHVELVDLFPTLADLSQITVPKLCPKHGFQKLCTEGMSLKPLIDRKLNRNSDVKWKKRVFSQYPRPSLFPQHNSDQPNLKDIKVMGYTMKNETLRYTQWIHFDPKTFKTNWSQVYAKELYLDTEEVNNVADDPKFKVIVQRLSKELEEGWRSALP